MSENLKDKKIRLLIAGERAVDELIKVLEQPIVTLAEDDLTADKLKNAASAKRLAYEDAIYMLEKIELERGKLEVGPIKVVTMGSEGFIEGKIPKNGR